MSKSRSFDWAVALFFLLVGALLTNFTPSSLKAEGRTLPELPLRLPNFVFSGRRWTPDDFGWRLH